MLCSKYPHRRRKSNEQSATAARPALTVGPHGQPRFINLRGTLPELPIVTLTQWGAPLYPRHGTPTRELLAARVPNMAASNCHPDRNFRPDQNCHAQARIRGESQRLALHSRASSETGSQSHDADRPSSLAGRRGLCRPATMPTRSIHR